MRLVDLEPYNGSWRTLMADLGMGLVCAVLAGGLYVLAWGAMCALEYDKTRHADPAAERAAIQQLHDARGGSRR